MFRAKFRIDIKPHIIHRGRQYFLEGCVEKLLKTSTGYQSSVRGTNLYDVAIEMNETHQVTDFACNCPDNINHPCKHVTATMFAIAEELGITVSDDVDTEDEHIESDEDAMELFERDIDDSAFAIPMNEFERILESATKDDLIQAMIRLVAQNPALRWSVAASLQSERAPVYAWMDLFEQIDFLIRDLDFEEYYDEMPDELFDLFDELADASTSIHNPFESLSMARRLSEVWNPWVESLTDSETLDMLVTGFFDQWKTNWPKCIRNAAFEQRMTAFRSIWDEIENDIDQAFEVWHDWLFDVIGGFFSDSDFFPISMSRYLSNQSLFERFLGNPYNKGFTNAHDAFQFKVLFPFWTREQQIAWLDDRTHHPTYRIERLRMLYEDGRYESMISLIDQYKVEYFSEEEVRFEILALVELKQYRRLRTVLKHQFSRGNDAQVETYLSTYPEDERDVAYEALLDDWAKDNDPYHMYRKRIINEGRKDRIIAACEAHPDWILDLYKDVAEEDLPRLDIAFRSKIETSMHYASDRSEYQKICHSIRKYGERFPSQKKLLVDRLMQLYPKRRAMIEELKRTL